MKALAPGGAAPPRHPPPRRRDRGRQRRRLRRARSCARPRCRRRPPRDRPTIAAPWSRARLRAARARAARCWRWRRWSTATLLCPMLAARRAASCWSRGVDALLARRAAGRGRAPRAAVLLGRAPNPVHARGAARCARRRLVVQLTRRSLRRAPSATTCRSRSSSPPRGRATVALSRAPVAPRRLRAGRPPRALPVAARALDAAGAHRRRARRCKVYPDVQAVRAYELLARAGPRARGWCAPSRLRGGESEFERLREYRRDDEFRSIDWKATARRQKLIAASTSTSATRTSLFLLDCGRLMTAETRRPRRSSTTRSTPADARRTWRRAPATRWACSPSPTASRATRPPRAARAPRNGEHGRL